LALVPVRISDEGSVIPVDFHGSAHISALNEADGIIFIPSGVRELGKGDMVSVRQI
jgi:molybdopterin molybdotransferase